MIFLDKTETFVTLFNANACTIILIWYNKGAEVEKLPAITYRLSQ